MSKIALLPVAIIGAGPYGLSISAHLSGARIAHRIFGAPMRTWEKGMPSGMLLKSEGFATNLSDPARAYTLAAYCAERGLPYADTDWGVSVEVFAAYGRAFQTRFVPQLEEVAVSRLERSACGFVVTLETGERVRAAQVVLATGLAPFAQIPPDLAALPEALVSHSRESADLRRFAGRHVAVVGGGASALDVAASLHRAGARATVISRRPELRFYPKAAPRRFDAWRAPRTPLGPGWKKLLCTRLPLVFHRLPADLRLRLVQRYLGAAPAYSVKETIEAHVDVLTGATIGSVVVDGDRARMSVRVTGAGAERGANQVIEADHVIAATGYRIDLTRLGYLDAGLRGQIRCHKGAPLLSSAFETSVHGLYMVGTAAAASFGPLLRFVCGAGFAARRITGRLERSGFDRLQGETPTDAPRIAFLTLTNDLGSDRIVSQMGREGAVCAVIGPRDSFAVASRFVRERRDLPGFGGATLARCFARGRLERLARDWAPDAIVPLDDLAARTLRRLAVGGRISDGLRVLIGNSVGDPKGYATACSRGDLLALAEDLGLRVPATLIVPTVNAARTAGKAFGYPVVLKREESCGSGGVCLIESERTLAPLYRSARHRATLKRWCAAVTEALSGERYRLPRGDRNALTLQAYVPGRLAMHTVACRNGRVLDGVSLVAEQMSAMPIGASTIVSAIDNAEMRRTAQILVARLGVSGFVSFDFLLDEAGRAHVIEMNPRPIGSTHLGAHFGHDLCRAYYADLIGVPVAPSAAAIWQGKVALFPRELARAPETSPVWSDTTLRHDLPIDDMAVVTRYLDHLCKTHPGSSVSVLKLLAREAIFEPVRSGIAPSEAA